ncbi:MAG TPA: hypothetical protein VFV40_05470 [Nocardioides sp.]|nr:hypothetical protein [Nocardioides sp.]
MARGWTMVVGAVGLALSGCGAPLVTDLAIGTSVPCGWHGEAAPAGVRSYRDVLPNTRFRERGSDEPAAPLTPLVVVGEVVAVAPGPGWTEAGDRVGFDDDAVLWKHAHATVAVAEVIGSAGWSSDTVTVAFPLEAHEDLGQARHILETMGRTVFPLYRGEGVGYAPDVWSVGPADAVLIAEVGAGGRLALPCVRPRRAARLLVDVPTLAELRRAAAGPLRERVVRATHRD